LRSMKDVLLVADMQGDDFDFQTPTSELGRLFPKDYTIWRIARDAFDYDEQVKQELLRKVNEGKLWVNYLGHGSVELWRGDIFTSDDADNLSNGSRLAFFVNMTCLNGIFHDVYSESLAEALLKAKQGGAVAVWASSGFTNPEGQVIMNKELIRLLFNDKELTLGEATAKAKVAVSDPDVRKTWILFGDPATKLKR
jgi:hypothetical protein